MIAVTDSGIEWCDPALVDKIYLNRDALPPPENATGRDEGATRGGRPALRLTTTPTTSTARASSTSSSTPTTPGSPQPYFCATQDGDGFGYSGISPADLIADLRDSGRARYYAARSGPAGFTDAIAGWNFVDDDNDPYDAVHYDHGTGTAEDAAGAADTLDQEVGTCPDCMVLPIKVGDSFITTGTPSPKAALFAVDSGATVIQEALGTST